MPTASRRRARLPTVRSPRPVLARPGEMRRMPCALLGDIAMHSHPPAFQQAAAYYQPALTLANALGMRPLQAHCHRGLGLLYATTGQRQQAVSRLRRPWRCTGRWT